MLTADRAAELANFAPGSDEHWYYRCLLAQQNGQLVEVDNMLKQWRRQHRYTDRFHRIQMQTLLWVEKDPSVGKAHDSSVIFHPIGMTQILNVMLIIRQYFQRRGLLGQELEDEFKQQGKRRGARKLHEWLSPVGFDAYLRRQDIDIAKVVGEDELKKVTWSDHPDLPRWICTVLAQRHSASFGSLLFINS